MSIEAIRAKLLPKFIATAKGRVEKARTAWQNDQPGRIREELHAITGDAGMIGQPEVAELARECSVHARAWDEGNADEKLSTSTSLEALSAKLDGLGARG